MNNLTALVAGMILLFFSVACSGCIGYQMSPAQPAAIPIGEKEMVPSDERIMKLPDWMYIPMTDSVSGKDITLSSLISLEKPLIIQTFTIWCPACTYQLQETSLLMREAPGRYQLLAIDIERNEDKERILGHIMRNNFSEGYYVSAPDEVLRGLVDVFGQRIILTMPQTAVICNETVYLFNPGAIPAPRLQQSLEELC